MRAGAVLATVVIAAMALDAPEASAQSSNTRPPTIDGTVAGDIGVGGELTFQVNAVAVSGWRNLSEIVDSAVVGGKTLETMTFRVADNQLQVGNQYVPVGTGASGSGTYLKVNATQVVVTTGGAHLSISIAARVIKALPTGVQFRLQAIDYLGGKASITRELNAGTNTGLTWGTVALAVVLALFAGGFVGNLFASRRRPSARPSVYATVQRRIDEGRSATRSSPGAKSGRTST